MAEGIVHRCKEKDGSDTKIHTVFHFPQLTSFHKRYRLGTGFTHSAVRKLPIADQCKHCHQHLLTPHTIVIS